MFARKYRIHAILILSVLAIIIAPQIMNKPDKNQTEASVNAANEFLEMIDQGNFADSWQIAAPYLRNNIPQQDWESKLVKIRETFGPVAERTLQDVNFTAPTDELPDSKVIMLEYATRFAKQSMHEVITLAQGQDNRWRVVGYFIQ